MMDDSDYVPLPRGGNVKAPRCVFCGMGTSAPFGQGELLRFRTNRTSLGLPYWYTEPGSPLNANRRPASEKFSQTSTDNYVPSTTSLPFAPLDHLVGDHCALDATRRIQEGRIVA